MRTAWNKGINSAKDNKKKCNACNIVKDVVEFHKNKLTLDGYNRKCKSCSNKWHKEYRNTDNGKKIRHLEYLRNRPNQKNQELKSTYGITLEQFNELRVKQDYLCAICGRHESESNKGLHVDHCHYTNRVRGLLCNSCNLAIGMLKHNNTILIKAIDYLKQ